MTADTDIASPSTPLASPDAGDGLERRFSIVPWLLFAPGLIALLLFFILPLANLAVTSLHPHLGMGAVGIDWTLENYIEFFQDYYYFELLIGTFALAGTVVLLSAVIGCPVAYFLARTRTGWRGVLTFIVVAPLMISAVVRNLGWFPILGESGLINWLLLGSGLIDQPVKLLHNRTGVVIGLVHALSPFMILSLMTVIQRIPRELEEAALSLGASPFATFRMVVLPLSKIGFLTGGALVFTISLSAFMTTSMMGGRRVQIIATYVEQQFRSLLNYPAGATATVVLLFVTLAVVTVALRAERRSA